MKRLVSFIISLIIISFAAISFGDSAIDCLKNGIENGQKGNYRNALDNFSKAIQLNPNFAEAYNERGLAECALSKNSDNMDLALANALSDYNSAIKLKPDFAAAYYNRGNLMQAQGDWNNAKTDFTIVVELKPKADYVLLAQAFLHLGLLAEREGNKTGARLNYAQAYFNSGLAKQKMKDWDGALADYTKTIDLDPGFFNYYNCRGSVREEKGDWNGAIADFNRAIELKPDFSFAYYNRGHAKFQKGDLDGALADYSKYIELNPTNADAFANRGIIKNKMGDVDGSLADFSKAIELNPKKRDSLKAAGYPVGEINTR